jgi:hypothetical protein
MPPCDGADTVAFGSCVSHEQLWFARAGDDLVMSVIDEGQAVTVAGWYAASANHAVQVTTGDGYPIGDAAIEQLVEAMFTPPAAGETTLPPALAANLAPRAVGQLAAPVTAS